MTDDRALVEPEPARDVVGLRRAAVAHLDAPLVARLEAGEDPLQPPSSARLGAVGHRGGASVPAGDVGAGDRAVGDVGPQLARADARGDQQPEHQRDQDEGRAQPLEGAQRDVALGAVVLGARDRARRSRDARCDGSDTAPIVGVRGPPGRLIPRAAAWRGAQRFNRRQRMSVPDNPRRMRVAGSKLSACPTECSPRSQPA